MVGWCTRRTGIIVAAFLITLVVDGCAHPTRSRRLMPTPIGIVTGMRYPGDRHVKSHGNPDEEIPIFILSGRNVEADSDALNPFGKKRSRIPSLGIAWVRIGEGLTAEELREETITARRRKKAFVEFSRVELSPPVTDYRPWRVKDDEVRHRDSPWVQAVLQQLDRCEHRHVVIFVHGYNTELIENTLLAAEIYHYLGREGAMVSFEWPSRANLLGYMADKGNATYSTRQFRALVSNVAKETEADSITIIAHSAGSPIVVNALREIRLLEYDLTPDQIHQKYRINRVVLAAPDMDTMAFVNAIHDRFYEVAGRVAVYASPRDKALGISEFLYDNSRLGKAVGRLQPWEQDVLRMVPEIEMVDASVAEEFYSSFLGHSYFHRDPWVSSDIGAFILGREPEARGLVKAEDGVFWKFPTDFPEQLEQIARTRPQTRWAEAETETVDSESEGRAQPLLRK